MAGPREEPWEPPDNARLVSVREAVFAGRFYPANPIECRDQAAALVAASSVNESEFAVGDRENWFGGIVPHAGWMFSGAIAGQTIATLARSPSPDLVVVFGAVHTPIELSIAALDVHQRWLTPIGPSEIQESLRAQLRQSADLFAVDSRFHQHEHAIEVELPLIALAWPNAAVLPVEVPAVQKAARIGRNVALQIDRSGLRAVYLASSDLTHYGPDFGFAPAGIGPAGFDWARQNDRSLLELVTQLQVERIVPEARSNLNACGAGAIAAMLAACKENGASRAKVLSHTNSWETLGAAAGRPASDAVGYASVVIG